MILDLLNINLLSIDMEAITLWEEGYRFLGIKAINVADFSELLIRFIINTMLIFFVVHKLYTKNSKRRDFYFSYIGIGVVVFLLCFLLNNVKLEMGFALGLFALFGIIRYRTDPIPIKEMTYLFIVIGISVINALSNKKVSYAELLFTNAAIVFGLYLLERYLFDKQELSVKMIYEKIENIHQENDEELLKDIKERTGLEVTRYEVKQIDFLKDVAELKLFYKVDNNIDDEKKK